MTSCFLYSGGREKRFRKQPQLPRILGTRLAPGWLDRESRHWAAAPSPRAMHGSQNIRFEVGKLANGCACSRTETGVMEQILRRDLKVRRGMASFRCPASKHPRTCSNHQCRMGAACRELWALGLRGNRSPLPRKERPACGARNRQGKPCAVRVEPGKRRCRFHGGLSTGPRTAAGRARIAEAQRRRWRAVRGAVKTTSRTDS
jgi:hypothetical protein